MGAGTENGARNKQDKASEAGIMGREVGLPQWSKAPLRLKLS